MVNPGRERVAVDSFVVMPGEGLREILEGAEDRRPRAVPAVGATRQVGLGPPLVFTNEGGDRRDLFGGPAAAVRKGESCPAIVPQRRAARRARSGLPRSRTSRSRIHGSISAA